MPGFPPPPPQDAGVLTASCLLICTPSLCGSRDTNSAGTRGRPSSSASGGAGRGAGSAPRMPGQPPTPGCPPRTPGSPPCSSQVIPGGFLIARLASSVQGMQTRLGREGGFGVPLGTPPVPPPPPRSPGGPAGPHLPLQLHQGHVVIVKFGDPPGHPSTDVEVLVEHPALEGHKLPLPCPPPPSAKRQGPPGAGGWGVGRGAGGPPEHPTQVGGPGVGRGAPQEAVCRRQHPAAPHQGPRAALLPPCLRHSRQHPRVTGSPPRGGGGPGRLGPLGGGLGGGGGPRCLGPQWAVGPPKHLGP